MPKNRQNLTPLPLCTQSYPFGLTYPPYAYVLSILFTPAHLPNKFLFRFKFSSHTISWLFSFLLVSEVKFH